MNPSTGMLNPKPRGLFGKLSTLNPWLQVGIVVFVLVIVCCAAGEFGARNAVGEEPAITPIPTTATTSEAASPERSAVTTTGEGNTVVQINAILNGTFRVDYSSGYDFLAVDFLKADGSDGMATFDMGINEYGDGGVTGSRILHFEDVTMVQVSNTQGAWSLTFTPV